MKIIYGYWALDGTPTPTGTLQAMQAARPVPAHAARQAWAAADGKLAFGSRWWSPQADLSAPACIATHPESGCAVVADARLDNPAELRAALSLPAPGDAPDSTTDHAASLILHAWLRWGEDCVDHIDGDFAFAVHDPRQRLLYLARDRMGGRPLYVHHVPGKRLVFGSTAHAVLAHPWVPKEVNEARIADYLVEGLEGVDFTSTFHLAVQRHPPRHVLRISPEGRHRRQYWELEPGRSGPLPNNDDDWADALTEVLERAVAQRLAGPHRTGSMLSGGLDSTSLAIIAGEQLFAAGNPSLPTFSSIDSCRAGCLETKAVHELTGLPYFDPTIIDHANLGQRLPAMLTFLAGFDEPFDGNMGLVDAQYLAAAGQGVSGVIDGIDGDTLFSAGGVMFRQVRSGHWRAALGNARGLARIYGGQTWRHLLPPVRAAFMPVPIRKLLWPLRTQRRRQQYLDGSLISPAFAEQVDVASRLEQLLALRSLTPWPGPEREAAEALSHTFPVVGLERYYRVAARHGVTPLHPFTERRVLELGVDFNDRQHLRAGWSKPILRHAMRGRMPETVRCRSDKQHLGWQLTWALWEPRLALARLWIEEERAGLASFVDMARLDALQQELDGPSREFAAHQLLRVAMLAQWLRVVRRPQAGDALAK